MKIFADFNKKKPKDIKELEDKIKSYVLVLDQSEHVVYGCFYKHNKPESEINNLKSELSSNNNKNNKEIIYIIVD